MKNRIASSFLSALFLLPGVATGAQAATVGDLSSTQHTVAASAAGNIRVGTQVMNVQTGQMLTPAESFALNQVLQSGRQTLVLGALGNALSGSLSINNISGANLGSLVIPRGVRVLDNVSLSQLALPGNLTNAGSLYLYSTSGSTASALLNATEIINQRGGLVSSIIPTNLLRGLSPIASLNLDLTALDNIINAGVIRSSGAISLTAGNTINNSGTISAAGTTGDVNLFSNNIVNSGLVQSLAGNINISANNTGNIAVNNANGVLQALLGNINVRDASFTAKSNFDLTGGNLLSKALNINSGNGIVNVDAKNITGLVNINAGEEHLLAATPNLKIGQLNLTGDPTIYNTNGNITLSSAPVTAGTGVNLAIVASGNITSSSSFAIDTSSATNGGNIILVAGAKFTSDGPASVLPPGSDTSSTLTITGGSKTGGEIDFLDHSISSLTSAGGSGTGGNITIIAYKGSGAGSGLILLPAFTTDPVTGALVHSSININAAGGTSNGDINIIGSAIEFGSIANGASGVGASNVTISAATPAIQPNGSNNAVQIKDGNFLAGSGTFVPGTLSPGNIVESTNSNPNGILASGNVQIQTGGAMQLANLTAGSGGTGTINLQTGGLMILDGQVKAPGNINIASTKGGTVEYFGDILSTAGAINISGGSVQGLNHLSTQIQNGSAWTFLLGATVAPAKDFVYVPDFNAGTISKISTLTNTVVSTTPLNGGLSSLLKPEGTAISPNGATLYVANSGNGTFSVVTTGTMTPGTPVAVPGGDGNPEAVAVNPSGTRLYVLCNTAPVFVMNGSSIALNANHSPKIQTMGQATLLIYDTSSIAGGPIKSIALGHVSSTQTGGIAVNPQGTFAYVTNSGSNSVSVINLSNNTVQTTINLPKEGFEYPIFIAMDPNGTRAYVADGFSNNPFITSASQAIVQGSILVIDTQLNSPTWNTVLANVPQPQSTKGAGTFPQGISVNPSGSELTVQSTYLNQINAVYTALNQTLEATFTGANAAGTRGSAPDGYGSSNFTTVLTNPSDNVPQQIVYTSNTFNLGSNNTVSVMVKPTIQASTINLTATSGDILVDYDAKGGTFIANASGAGIVMANSLGAASSTVTNSSASGKLFEVAALGNLTVGNVASPHVVFQTTGASSITVNGTVGTSTGLTEIKTGTGDILEGTSGLVVGKTVNLSSMSGTIDHNFTSNTFTSEADPNNPLQISNLQLPNIGQGPIRITSFTVNGTPQVEGTDYTFNDTTGVVTFINEPASGATIALSSKTPFQTAASNITAITGDTAAPLAVQSGSVYINNTSKALTLTGATGIASGTSAFQLATNGTITAPHGVSAPNVDLRSVGNLSFGGPIGFGNDVGTSVKLNTGGKGAITATSGGEIFGQTLTLASGSGGIGTSKAPIILETSQILGASSGGSIFLSQTGTNSTITIGSVGDVVDPISTPGTFSLTNKNSIVFAGTAIAHSGVLVLNSVNGSIGGLGTPFGTDATSITIGAGTDAYIEASAPGSIFGTYTLTINKSSAGGTFSVDTVQGSINTTGNIKVAGVISAPFVDLATNAGTNGSITLGANVGTAGTGSTTIQTDNVVVSGLTSDTIGNAIVRTGGVILSPTVTLTSAYGNVGTSAAPIQISASGSGTSLTVVAGNLPPANTTGTAAAFIKGTGNVTLTADAVSHDVGALGRPINISTNGNLTFSAPAGNAFVNVTSGNVVLAGSSNVLNVLSIGNSSGALTLTGTGTVTGPAKIDLSAKTNLTVNTTNPLPSPSSESLTAGGILTLPTSSISVVPKDVNGDGGTITIAAQTLKFSGSSLFSLSANAGAGTNGNGGSISLTVRGTTPYSISSTGQLQLNATPSATGTAGDGGDITVSLGGNVTVDQSGLYNLPVVGNGGNGGNTSVTAGGTLTVTGGLSTKGDGAGNGGSLSLASGGNMVVPSALNAGTGPNSSVTVLAKGAKPFQVGGPSTTNGAFGTITANSIRVGNPSGISVNTGLTASGTIEFDTSNLVNNSSLTGEQTLLVNAGSGSLVVSGTGTWGSPTGATLKAGGGLTTGPLFTAATTTAGFTPAVIDIEGGGAVKLGFGNLTAVSTTSQPGRITISGSSVSFTGSGPHVLTARGLNVDGIVQFIQKGTAALSVGNGANDVEIDVTSAGATTAGSINVTSGGVLSVNVANGLKSDSGLSTDLTLVSGGALQVTGAIDPVVGTAANLVFGSKSATPFTIGIGSQANGVSVSATPLQAASISITNLGGAIGSAVPVSVNTGSLTLAGKTTVNASDSASSITLGKSSAGTSFTLSAPSATLTASTTITTPSLNVTLGDFGAKTINTKATTINGGAGASGNFSVTDSATGAVKLGTSAPINAGNSIFVHTGGTLTVVGALSAPTVDLASVGTVSIGAPIGTAGGISISIDNNQTGSIVQTNAGITDFLGGTLTLNSGGSIGSSTIPLQTSVTGVSAQAGVSSSNVFINNIGAATLDVSSGLATKTFQITTTGTMTVTGSITFAPIINLTSNTGSIDLTAPIGFSGDGIFSKGGTVTMSAANSITESTNTGLVRGEVVTLSAGTGNIGAIGNELITSAINLKANAGGNVAIIAKNGNLLIPYVISIGNSSAGVAHTFSVETLKDNGPFSIPQDSSIQVNGPITGGTISLITGPGSEGSVVLGAAVGNGLTTAVNLTADGGGSIINGTGGSVTGGTVTLVASTGNIGTTAAPIKLNGATSLTAKTGGTGTVSLVNNGGTGLTVGASSSGGSFSLVDTTAGSGLTISGAITTNTADNTAVLGNLTLVETTGSMNIGASLTANEGSIIVQNKTANGASIDMGTVSISTVVNGSTADGMITIAFGTVPAPQSNPGVFPVGITIGGTGGGQAFAGSNTGAITGTGTLNLDGANIVFNVPGSGAINLNNTTITADPTIVPAAPTTVVRTLQMSPFGVTTGTALIPPASAISSGILPSSSATSTTPTLNVPNYANAQSYGSGSLPIIKSLFVLPTTVDRASMVVVDIEDRDNAVQPTTHQTAAPQTEQTGDIIIDTSEE